MLADKRLPLRMLFGDSLAVPSPAFIKELCRDIHLVGLALQSCSGSETDLVSVHFSKMAVEITRMSKNFLSGLVHSVSFGALGGGVFVTANRLPICQTKLLYQ